MSIGDAVAYNATVASTIYREGRKRCGRRGKLMEGTQPYQKVYDRLVYWGWSPQQISNGLRLMHPDDPSNWISHETIYAAIYAQPRGALKQGMVDALSGPTPVAVGIEPSWPRPKASRRR